MIDYKEVLTNIYSIQFPVELGTIDDIINKTRGHEKEYLINLCRSYNINIIDHIKVDYSWLITSIIQKYEPSNVNEIPSILANYKELEDDLIKTLCLKHNINLNDLLIKEYIYIAQANAGPNVLFHEETNKQPGLRKEPASKKKNILLFISIPILIAISIFLTLYFSGFFSKESNKEKMLRNQFVQDSIRKAESDNSSRQEQNTDSKDQSTDDTAITQPSEKPQSSNSVNSPNSSTNTILGEKTVTATSGLLIRVQPGVNNKWITLIPYHEKVQILENGKQETIDNISGRWVKVKWKGYIGWSFDGYLN